MLFFYLAPSIPDRRRQLRLPGGQRQQTCAKIGEDMNRRWWQALTTKFDSKQQGHDGKFRFSVFGRTNTHLILSLDRVQRLQARSTLAHANVHCLPGTISPLPEPSWPVARAHSARCQRPLGAVTEAEPTRQRPSLRGSPAIQCSEST